MKCGVCLPAVLLASAAFAADNFVLVKGGVMPGQESVRVDNFEIGAHPVTNAEYKQFVAATGHAAPQHWESGRIPAGLEQYPVIFVNRYDAEAYAKWRSSQDGRVYRLPTFAEFEYAARASRKGAYPWGDETPEGRANFDAKGDRVLADWKRFLKPVKSYGPNAWNLYDMAGNVWQMVLTNYDPATMRYVFRLASLTQKESTVTGGSWARRAYFLRTGVRSGAPPGSRLPDLGFRLVREPAGGTTHFRTVPRRVAAAASGEKSVYIGWQMLPEDKESTCYNVYRTARRDAAGTVINAQPVCDSTNFVDANPNAGRYYRIRSVDGGREGPPSEWAAVASDKPRRGLAASFIPTVKQGMYVPVFGDLDGDGALDAVVRLNNGIQEMSRDPGVPVELEAFTSYGRALWRRPLVWHNRCYSSANNVPVVVYDLDGDGKAEVVARYQEGSQVYLAVLNGMTGEVVRKTPWTEMATDTAGTGTRIHMAIAYLDGRNPAIVTQTGLYENEIIDAYDASLKKLWTYKSFGATTGSGSHHTDIADVDGDGRDEVFDGTTALNPDGTLRWSIYRQHPDKVAIKRILPGTKGRQVFYAIESATHAGLYVVDAPTGRILWKANRENDPAWQHVHRSWIADIWDGSPGLEIMASPDKGSRDQWLYSAAGKRLLAITSPAIAQWSPVNWRGTGTREVMPDDGKSLARFNGREFEKLPLAPNTGTGECSMVADLIGDFRDEIVCVETGSGSKTPGVYVYTNLEPVSHREITRTANREYRVWMGRNWGGGYPQYFEWQP